MSENFSLVIDDRRVAAFAKGDGLSKLDDVIGFDGANGQKVVDGPDQVELVKDIGGEAFPRAVPAVCS